MDFFERIGNFVTGGGWSSNTERSKSDAERKRREEEERRRKAEEARRRLQESVTKKTAQPTPAPLVEKRPSAFVDAKKPEEVKPKPILAPRGNSPTNINDLFGLPKVKDQDLMGLSEEDKLQIYKLRSEGKNDTAQRYLNAAKAGDSKRRSLITDIGEVAKATGQVGKDVLQGTARVPETIFRSALLEPLVGNATRKQGEAISTASDKNTGLRAFLYGEDPVQSYQEQAREVQSAVAKLTQDKALTNLAVFVAPAIAALDLATGGRGRSTVQSTEQVIRAVERSAGRKLDDIEKAAVKEEVESAANIKVEEPVTAPTAPSRPEEVPKPTPVKEVKTVAEAPREAQDVATSYQTVYNHIIEDPNLSTQERTNLIKEARKRHTELLKQVDTRTEQSVQAQQEVVKQADELAQAESQQQASRVAQVEAQRAEQTAPPVSQLVEEPDIPVATELRANNAYDESFETVAQREARQQEMREAQKVNPLEKVWNSVRRQAYDPLLVTQKVDNTLKKAMKQEGTLARGQKELSTNQSVVSQTRIISNPDKMVKSLLRDTGMEDTVKAVKKQGKEYEDTFNNYRLFKDELFNQEQGNPALVSISPEEMAAYVARVESQYPEMVDLNGAIRQYHLALLRRRTAAGIEDPALLQAAEQNPFYAPRNIVEAEDALKPVMGGSFNRGAKQTKSRTASENSEVNLDSIFYDGANTIRGEAAQQRAQLLIRSELGEVTQSAENAAIRRESLKEADSIRQDVDALKGLRDTLAKDARKMKAAAIKATSKGKQSSKKAQAQAEATMAKAQQNIEKQLQAATTKLEKAIEMAKTDENSVFRDLVARDPRYYDELAQIEKNYYPPSLSPKELKDQIRLEKQQLDAKYPQPNLTRQNLNDLVRQLSGIDQTVREVAPDLRQADELFKQADVAAEQADALKGMLNQARQEIADNKADISGLYGIVSDFKANPRTGKTEITYYHDGAQGKIAIPPELAREWAISDKQFRDSGIGRFIEVMQGVQKTALTGNLAPGFNLISTPIFNPLLMFYNGDGLSAFNAKAISQFFKSLGTSGRQFRSDAVQAGAQYENATKSLVMRRGVMDDIEAHASLGNFIKRNPVKTAGDFWRALNNGLAHISNAQRDQVIAGAVARIKRLNPGMSDEDALQYGAQAAARTFGDFSRVSRLAQSLDAAGVPMFAGAMQAGARALNRTAKVKPAETALKLGLTASALGGFAAWSLQNEAQQYYDAMDAAGQSFDYENNVIVATGKVSQNEDGSWNNIVKIPLTPDFRPLNRLMVATMRDVKADAVDEDTGYNALSEVLNLFTADAGSNFYEPSKTDNGKDPLGGVLPQTPIVNYGRILGNRNIYNGGELLDDADMALSKDKQVFDSTSEAARQLSALLGSVVSPVQVDQLLSQFGTVGKSTRALGNEGKDPLTEFFNPGAYFTPRKATDEKALDNRAYFKDVDDVANEFRNAGVDKATFNAYQALNSKKNQETKDNMLNTAANALQFMKYSGDGNFNTTQLYAMQKALDQKTRDRGGVGNPLYDLAPQELRAVLTYRSMKIPNAAGQNFTKDGMPAFTALGLDEPWYQDFRDAESNFYNSIKGEGAEATTPKTFSGKVAPQLTPEQRNQQNYYFALPAGSSERKAFLDANQWLKDYWADDNEFTDQERKALGFRLEDEKEFKKGGGGGGTYSPFGMVGEVLNLANVKNAPRSAEKPYDQVDAQLAAALAQLFAPRRGGKANVTLGAKSSGQQ